MTGLMTAPAPVRRGAPAGTQAGLLARHFFRRFLDNDLVSPNGETQANLGFVLAFLAVPGLWMTLGLVFSYTNPWTTPSERLLQALDDKFKFISNSMIVMALATVVQWDALSLDRRDLQNLGPLPLAPRVLFAAKVRALLLYLAAFAAALNAAPAIFFPFVYLSLVPLGVAHGVWLVLVHAFTSLSAAAFSFFAVLGIRSVLALTLGPRLFRLASTAIQFLAVLALVTLFLVLPALSSGIRARLAVAPSRSFYSPPMWFVGLYESLTARRVLGDEQLTAQTAWRYWRDESEFRAREEYIRLEPTLDRLALVGAGAVLAAILIGFGLYLVDMRRYGRITDERAPGAGAQKGLVRRSVHAVVESAIVRRPESRAVFFFTLQALARSGRHRLYVAGYLAVGLAIAAAIVTPLLDEGGVAAVSLASPSLFAIQLLLVFFLVAGLRFVVEVPAALKANWLFRVSEREGASVVATGVWRALILGVFLPFLLLLLPLHAAFWGWRIASFHFVFGFLVSGIVLQVVLFGFRKVPFACSYLPGKGHIKLVWPLYLLLLGGATWALSALEHHVTLGASGEWTMIVSFWVALGVVAVFRMRMAGCGPLVFDEEPETAAQVLGLSG
ncbi:MAG: hypothetical protein ACE148_06805 [Vicinamibacterales bacterium]